jgi:hypothetical protein
VRAAAHGGGGTRARGSVSRAVEPTPPVQAVTNASEHSHEDRKTMRAKIRKLFETTAVTWQLYFTKVKD